MAYALFISNEDLRKNSALSGNLDDDKMSQFIRIAMDIHVKNYTGTDLFDRLQAGLTADDLTANESNLLDNYIKPMAIHWGLVEVMGFVAYTIGNKGVYKRFAEESESVSKEEIDTIIQRHRNIAENYTERFIKYMQFNDALFPQYTSNTDDNINPDKEAYFSGWEL